MNNFNFRLWKIGVLVAFFCAVADALGVYVAAESVIWGKVIAFAVIKGMAGAALYMRQHPIEKFTEEGSPAGSSKTSVYAWLLIGALALSLTGCVVRDKQVLDKSTVFGLQAVSPGPSGGQVKIQIGLVRNLYWSNPTSTNEVHAAPYNSAVHARMGALRQDADEYFGTDSLPVEAYTGTNAP